MVLVSSWIPSQHVIVRSCSGTVAPSTSGAGWTKFKIMGEYVMIDLSSWRDE